MGINGVAKKNTSREKNQNDNFFHDVLLQIQQKNHVGSTHLHDVTTFVVSIFKNRDLSGFLPASAGD
jgi:hypothetical protein